MDVPLPEAHTQKGMLEKKTAALFDRLRSMFPAATLKVTSSWAGTFAATSDGLPYIGRSSEWKNAFFALGYGGNGITMSLVAADFFRDEYLGRKNPDRGLFRFDRPSRRD